jgi:hypothetical protein
MAHGEEDNAGAQADAPRHGSSLAEHDERVGDAMLVEEPVDDPERVEAELVCAAAEVQQLLPWRGLVTPVRRNDETYSWRQCQLLLCGPSRSEPSRLIVYA